MEAGGGIGRLKRRFQVKNTIFFRLIKHYSVTTQTNTFTAPLLTFLLTVLNAGASNIAKGAQRHEHCDRQPVYLAHGGPEGATGSASGPAIASKPAILPPAGKPSPLE